jgi:SAM-dependent methyltransferase
MPGFVHTLRRLLRRLHNRLRSAQVNLPPEPFDRAKVKAAETALRNLPEPDAGAKAYLELHLARLARTVALVPEPQKTGRALELGCFMQITPLLQQLCGYREVRGAYYGRPGRVDRKTMPFAGGEFVCLIDHFDAERDPFPYPDANFDLVIAAEIIEHLTYDPMHMLLEARRVLQDGGHLLITTPNVGSITSVAKTLDGRDNPQIFYLYKRPVDGEEPEIGHVREYTAYELGEAVRAAGFEVIQLFTTFIEDFSMHLRLLALLKEHDYSIENRGEQTWCLAVKRASLPVDRFPYFLYSE